MRRSVVAALLLAVPPALWGQRAAAHIVRVLDGETGRGVPMVQLCATSAACFWSDSAGVIALDEDSFFGREVAFAIDTRGGYSAPRDFFGEPGATLSIRHGGDSTIRLRRDQPAERLYRATGEGIYRDSARAGLPVPLPTQSINARVTGLDTVMHAPYRGSMFWIFGDTNDLSAPLGNFASTAATSPLTPRAIEEAERTIELNYIAPAGGFVSPVAAIPGPGMKWLSALMVLRDPAGQERLLARYDRHKSLTEVHDSGLLVFNDGARRFEPLVSFGAMPRAAPHGRPTRVAVNGRDYFYFSWPQSIPSVRVPAEWAAVRDLARYEAYTCEPAPCRWSREATPHSPQFVDHATGKPFDGRATSVYWNGYLGRWLAVVQGAPGDVYLAMATAPEGPYSPARRVIRHTRYNFYWPTQLPEFDRDGGRRILIMGTYTQSFSDAPVKVPRYDYNQLVYGVSLDDPRLGLSRGKK